MEDSFKLLEEKVHRAAERLKALSAEAQSLRGELAKAQARAEKAEKALAEASERQGAEAAQEKEALASEVKALRREREEIRDRIGKLLGLLERL
jgi:FtsZ-binding cell division protein ZapB